MLIEQSRVDLHVAVKRVTGTRYYDNWSELLKPAIMTSEANYWNKPLSQVNRVIETPHCDMCNELFVDCLRFVS